MKSARRWSLLLVMLGASVVSAQQAPLGDPLRLGQAASPTTPATPFWGSGSSVSDLPAADIRAVAPARAQATAARWAYWNAQDKLSDLIRDQRLAFEESPEYLAALAAENNAYRAYVAERERVLALLRDDPSYVASLKIHDELGRQLEELRALPPEEVDRARIEAIARVKVQVLENNRRLEDDALARDSRFQAARQHWREMAGVPVAMRTNFARGIRNNAELKAVREQIADLRVARQATQAYYQSTVRAANVALDYAYWSRYQDRYAWTSTPCVTNWGGVYGSSSWTWRWWR